MNAFECAPTDLDTATGLGIQFLTRPTGLAMADFARGTEQMATEEARPAIDAAGTRDREQIGCCGSYWGLLRSAAVDRWEQRWRSRGWSPAEINGGDLTCANKFMRTTTRGFDAPQRARIEDCAWGATHYWVERKSGRDVEESDMGAVPSVLKRADFLATEGSIKAAADLFDNWAQTRTPLKGLIEKADSGKALTETEAREVAAFTSISAALALVSRFLSTKKKTDYYAMLLYADMGKKDAMYVETPQLKDSFAAAVEYVENRVTTINREIAILKEAAELVEFKKAELAFAREDERIVNEKIRILEARLKALVGKRGGAYRFPRRYSRKFCRRTTCKRMGFTQKASCRPYKNCYRRTRRSVSAHGR